jgi:hypothetical protein
MRISAYARATNSKYANFFDWEGLASQLGTKASGALNAAKGALPTTAAGYGKLGAGIGAGVGAINYLGSDDKSIGNLAGQVAGGAAVGGAVGYGGASLNNAYQARKAGQVGGQAASQGGNPSAPQSAPTVSNVPQSQAVSTAPQAQSPAASSTTAATTNTANQYRQQGQQNYNQNGIPDLSRAEPDGTLALNKSYKRGVQPTKPANPEDYGQSNSSRNISPFANFKVRRYNGFVY